MISQVILLAALTSLAASFMPIHEPIHHAPHPYKFGYDIKDKHGEQYRHEEGTGGAAVKGSYGFTDARGVKRHVDYVADHAGFRAQVKTNEPGTANQNPAAVHMVSDAPYAGGVAHGYGGLGYGGYGLGNVGLGYGVAAPGYAGLGGLGYAGLGGLGYGVGGLGYGAGGFGYGVGGLGYGLGGLGYARYGY